MTDEEFLDVLEARVKDKKTPFFVTGDERTKLHANDFWAQCPGSTKRSVIQAELQQARARIVNRTKERILA